MNSERLIFSLASNFLPAKLHKKVCSFVPIFGFVGVKPKTKRSLQFPSIILNLK
jgi:hypothetical protein